MVFSSMSYIGYLTWSAWDLSVVTAYVFTFLCGQEELSKEDLSPWLDKCNFCVYKSKSRVHPSLAMHPLCWQPVKLWCQCQWEKIVFCRHSSDTERSRADLRVPGLHGDIDTSTVWSMEGPTQCWWWWKNKEKKTCHAFPFLLPGYGWSSICSHLFRKTSQSLLIAFPNMSLCPQHHRNVLFIASRCGHPL